MLAKTTMASKSETVRDQRGGALAHQELLQIPAIYLAKAATFRSHHHPSIRLDDGVVVTPKHDSLNKSYGSIKAPGVPALLLFCHLVLAQWQQITPHTQRPPPLPSPCLPDKGWEIIPIWPSEGMRTSIATILSHPAVVSACLSWILLRSSIPSSWRSVSSSLITGIFCPCPHPAKPDTDYSFPVHLTKADTLGTERKGSCSLHSWSPPLPYTANDWGGGRRKCSPYSVWRTHAPCLWRAAA